MNVSLRSSIHINIIDSCDKEVRSTSCACPSTGSIHLQVILEPRARRFLVTWSWNVGLWKQPLPDVRKFLTSGHACAEVTNITAHARKGFLSLTAPLGKKLYFLSSLQRVASLGCFENTDSTQLGFIRRRHKQKPAEHTVGLKNWDN